MSDTNELVNITDEALLQRLHAARQLVEAYTSELVRRAKSRLPVQVCACGHPAQDPRGQYCTDMTCERGMPF